jgi:hypothetical protein
MASVSRVDDLEAAWAELDEVNASLGWYVAAHDGAATGGGR